MKSLFQKAIPQFMNETDSYHDVSPQILEYLNFVIQLDRDGHPASLSQSFAEKYGYQLNDFDKSFFDIFIHNDAAKAAMTYFKKALLGRIETFHSSARKKNGQAIDVNITLIPLNIKPEPIVYAVVNDISEYRKWERAQKQSQQAKQVFNQLENICYFSYDATLDKFHFSEQFTNFFGINADNCYTPTHSQLRQHVYKDDRESVNKTFKEALDYKTDYQIEYRIPTQDKKFRYVLETANILLDENGHIDGLVGFIQDITYNKFSDKYMEKEKQLTPLYDNPDVGLWTMNMQDGRTISNSKGIEHISGYSIADFRDGLLWNSIVHPQDLKHFQKVQRELKVGNTVRHQYRIFHKNGSVKWVQDYAVPILDASGDLFQINGMTSDITMQKELEEQINYLSEYDPLTKLPNRNYFYKYMEQMTASYIQETNKFAIMMLNIVRFKYVNDTLGHEIGDELLVKVAERISQQLTDDDTLARQDGAQFSILIGKIYATDALKKLAKKIIHTFEEPFIVKDFQLYVTVCIGIAVFPDNGTGALELYRNAEHALTKSKGRGENKYHLMAYSNNIQSYKCFSIGRDMKKAIKENEMVMYYQPRVDTQTNKMISAEALIRWNHPEWGHISPSEFLTIAEENGLITDIDNWVINEVCHQIKKWKNAGLPLVPISVNVSAAHLANQDWPMTVAKALEDTGIEPQDIELEITENSLLTHEQMVQNAMEIFHKLGIKIALDDFGKGYSSLLCLTQYHFDIIKIDKSFIQSMHNSERDLFIAKSIMYLAEGLQIRVVAEGVETMEQLNLLRNENCHEIQGYLFSHPLPAKEFEHLLEKEILLPTDPKQKAERKNRLDCRLCFPYPISSSMRIISIAGNKMQLGKSIVLIEEMSIDGLRCASTLKLPVRDDVVFLFETEIMNKPIELFGRIVWKEELDQDLIEYGIQFIISDAEQEKLSKLLELTKNIFKLPPHNTVKEDKYQYLIRVNS